MKTDLGKTFKQLQRKKVFQEMIDVAGDVVNGIVLYQEESEYATYGFIVMGISSFLNPAIPGELRVWMFAKIAMAV